jgi:uncharacterized protein (DUF1330 family)
MAASNAASSAGKDSADPARRGLRAAASVYIVAQLRFIDRAAYDRYQARFMDVFRRFEGRLLAADEAPSVLEGAWKHDKLVLMSFPTEAQWRRFALSPEYQEILKDRKEGTGALVLSG